MTRAWSVGMASLLACLGMATFSLAAETAPAGPGAPPAVDVIQAKVYEWTAQRLTNDPDRQRQVIDLWKQAQMRTAAGDPEAVLQRVMFSFALAHADTSLLLEELSIPTQSLTPPDARGLLNAADLGPFYQANFRLWYGQSLVHREMFEEALDVFQPVAVAETVDPASFLFYRATCEKALFKKAEGLATLEQLLTQTPHLPERYRAVGELMRAELEAQEEKSLDEVATKMSDVQRRLKLARAGQKVQNVEQEVVDLLDELIKQAEEQQQKQQQQQQEGEGQPNSQNEPGKPAQESRIKGSTAPGEVVKKKLKPGANWGNLDDKERAKARNMIARDFPAHYRQAIEEYFKKLATREPQR